jgi:aminoglycoside/choline kinase family phosphotransferase/tRNA A37 threonylcarbamoyladenosine biosynthesis protein TsaE
VVALRGEPGAGKTTFVRALIGALTGVGAAEVPGPASSLARAYAMPRLAVTHFDFHRPGSADEARGPGLKEAIEAGAVIVEVPERARELLPADRCEIELARTGDPGTRRATLRGFGAAVARVSRLGELMGFLEGLARWRPARIAYLQGDASTRAYARLDLAGKTALLMDAPHQPDGPPVRDGKPYSRIAFLAEDMVRPFVAIGAELRRAGLSAPEVLAMDLDRGLLLVEDLGDRTYGAEVASGTSQAELWRAAVDALVHLRGVPVPAGLPLPDGTTYVLPRRDRGAFEIEIELLMDWYWPALKGAAAPQPVRAEFAAVWTPVLDRLLALPGGWFLRDFHSPNLLWLPQRRGIARVGIIDFQDAVNEHQAFDLVSLLQDARITVAEPLERELFAYYCDEVASREPGFDRAAFAAAYADFGAQRNTRLLGLWARLLKRDGKPRYLQHIPRTWGYLERNLRADALAPLAAWYDRHFPPHIRTATFQG